MKETEKNLNAEQNRVLENTEGVKLVVSGPGTGKTTTVTRFLSRIIEEKKASPEEILAVTFTNKAAEEMKSRVKEITGENPYVSTIHYFAASIMREFPARGYSSDFKILDEKEQFRLIARITNRLRLERPPDEVSEKLTLARNLRQRHILEEEGLEEFYHQYLAYLRDQQSMDFDGLLTWCLDTLHRNSEALFYCRSRFKYVLVDEFQDISPLQYSIIKLLVGARGNLLCVGDFDQGIYSFRGADINIMLNLRRDFPSLTTYYLERNYRSTLKLVNAANRLIHFNARREEKPHWTKRKEGEDISVIPFRNPREESRFIASCIKKEASEGYSYGDFAVIYRINTLSQALESTFSAEGIPYLVMGGPGFFHREEVQDVLSFFKLAADPENIASLNRAGSVLARVNGEPFSGFSANPSESEWLPKLLDIVNNISSRPTLLESYRLLLHLTGYLKYLKRDKSVAGERKVKHVEYLEEVIGGVSRRSNRLEDLLHFAEKTDPALEYRDSVKLLTIHSVKGLEFETVFLAGATNDMLPHYLSSSSGKIEEERRLFYVAVTRAKNRLLITYPESKKRSGRASRQSPSPFIQELTGSRNSQSFTKD